MVVTTTPLIPWVVNPTGTATSLLTSGTETWVPGGTHGKFGIDLTTTSWLYQQTVHTMNTATSSPPATGEIRLNNSTMGSVTHIYASLTGQSGGNNTARFAAFGIGDVLEVLQVNQEVLSPGVPVTPLSSFPVAQFTITGKATVGSYVDFTVTAVSAANTPFTNGVVVELLDTSAAALDYGGVASILRADYFPNGIGGHSKFFDGNAGWATSQAHFVTSGFGIGANEIEPVLCAKNHTSASFATLIHSMASTWGKTWWACYWQEPEDDFVKGNLSISTYQAAFQDMYAVRAAAGADGALCKLVPMLENYQEQDKKPNLITWRSFLPISGVQLDCVGWDVYDAWTQHTNWNFAANYMPLIQASAVACNTGWALGEWGIEMSAKSPGGSDTVALMRARQQAVFAACQADANFKWCNFFFDNIHSVSSYSSSYGSSLIANPTVMSDLQALVAAS